MRQAMRQFESNPGFGDCFFFAAALFQHGGKLAEREACEAVLSGMENEPLTSDALLVSCLDCSLQRRDHDMIARMLAKMDGEQLAKAVDHVDHLISDSSFYFTYDKVVLPVLDRLRNYSGLNEVRRRRYSEAYETVRSKVAKQAGRANNRT
jgi:hypothetical protein